ncbi:hypothetical protein [Shimazuella alba]|uniref:Uncharacterized protein n=1 Tax=Shimazuella alba TaxID=2690964 RepID=A0A6I4VUW5_9BACL|nr:hypothetical protein [Shimazuella alba]MXQ54783.1 hypothetical protein [Shimazuella alba]
MSGGTYEKIILAEAEAIRELQKAVANKSTIKNLKTPCVIKEVSSEELLSTVRYSAFVSGEWKELNLNLQDHQLQLLLWELMEKDRLYKKMYGGCSFLWLVS